jgi:bacterioferritin (cytochrome b1)
LNAQEDLIKAVGAAQSALETFKGYSHSNLDNASKQIFKELAINMERHVDLLAGRLTYINQDNNMEKPLS